MTEIVVALVGGIFLVVTTKMNRDVKKQTKTQNGTTMGEYVERTYIKLGHIEEKLDSHIADKEAHCKDG